MTDHPPLDLPGLTREEMEVGLHVAKVGIGRVDYRSDRIVMTAVAARIFGVTPGASLTRGALHARIHPDDWPVIETEVERLLAADAPDVMDASHRILHDDGSVRWVNVRKQVTFDRAGPGRRPVTGVFAVMDITAARRADEQTEFLIGELNHRTKNIITVIASIARNMRRHSRAESFQDALIERLMGLARNQEAISRMAPGQFDLRAVFEQQIAPFGQTGHGRVRLEGEDRQINPDAAQTLAMVAHELLTNASKYGALSNDTGRIAVSWGLEPEAPETFRLDWVETGVGGVTVPGTEGYGSQVLGAMTRATLNAEVDLSFEPDGLTARFRMPLARLLPNAS